MILHSYFIQYFSEWMLRMKDNNCSKANPIKTSDTLDFSIKSSTAFSAASQASLSMLFPATATSTSFCVKKENALRLGNNQVSTQ